MQKLVYRRLELRSDAAQDGHGGGHVGASDRVERGSQSLRLGVEEADLARGRVAR
jgi:hypothetical protein